MAFHFELDLSELFFWVSTSDMEFGELEGTPACYVTAKSEDQKLTSTLLILKQGKQFMVGETIISSIDNEDGVEIQEMRHTSLLCQDYKIPSAIPKNQYFLGPMNEVNMLRIVHLVQATLIKYDEMIDYTLGTLNEKYPADSKHGVHTPYKAESNILTFPPRHTMTGS